MTAPALVAAALTMAIGACATSPRRDSEEGAMDATEPVVFDARTGSRLGATELDQRVRAADVVLVGEHHGDRDMQRTELAVLRYAYERAFTILAVEWLPFFMRDAVRRLDGLAPAVSLPKVLDDLRWAEVWGHDFESYAPILGWAFEHVAVEPINARRELTRAVAKGGVEAVPPELRAELPPLDTGNDAHRQWFAALMAGHAHGAGAGMVMPPEVLARYYLAQLTWDETMAAHVRTLATRGKVVVMAGLGHVERGLGIPARLGSLRALVVVPVADSAEAARRASDADFPDRAADLLWQYPLNRDVTASARASDRTTP